MRQRIAIVDDSEVALRWAKEQLSRRGYDVVTHAAALGIQSFVRATCPSLLLLDVRMPALNGDLVCKMLKERAATRDVPVLLYSSMPEDDLRELAYKCGADGHISKTCDGVELAAQIGAALVRP